MLLSMTGFGEARCQCDGRAVSVEVRTINSRYLKLSTRISEGYASLEPQIEAIVRERVRRATIQVNVRIDRARTLEDYKIDVDVLDGYRRQLLALQREWNLAEEVCALRFAAATRGSPRGGDGPLRPGQPVALGPGNAGEGPGEPRPHAARGRADDVRRPVGQLPCRGVRSGRDRAPLAAGRRELSPRLAERLKRTLAELDVALDPADIIKEVSLFADRSDISEETVRLRSHFEQFEAIVAAPESSGRKLDFLTQEMNREANTIGSKAGDVEISRQVIEIKSAIERIREMIQNVE